MKKHLIIYLTIFFSFLAKGNCQDTNDLNQYLMGKHSSIIKKYRHSFDFDSVTTILSISDFGETNANLTNVICFHDTIIGIVEVNDLKLFDQPSTIEETHIDLIRFQTFRNYFNTQYQTEPNLTSVPLSVRDFRLRVGFACGVAGKATKIGKQISQMRKDSVDSETVKKLLLSLNPLSRIIGFLVYDEVLHLDCKTLHKSLVKQNTFHYDFCRGCIPSMYTLEDFILTENNYR